MSRMVVPASGPPICHGEMRRSEYERPGDYLCMQCGTWVEKEKVEAMRRQPKPEKKERQRVRVESLTVDGVTYRTAAETKADWCFVTRGPGALALLTTREMDDVEYAWIKGDLSASVIVSRPICVTQLPTDGFLIDAQGKRVPL